MLASEMVQRMVGILGEGEEACYQLLTDATGAGFRRCRLGPLCDARCLTTTVLRRLLGCCSDEEYDTHDLSELLKRLVDEILKLRGLEQDARTATLRQCEVKDFQSDLKHVEEINATVVRANDAFFSENAVLNGERQQMQDRLEQAEVEISGKNERIKELEGKIEHLEGRMEGAAVRLEQVHAQRMADLRMLHLEIQDNNRIKRQAIEMGLLARRKSSKGGKLRTSPKRASAPNRRISG